MSRVVLKYVTNLPSGTANIPVGETSRILDILIQSNYITFWVEHEYGAPMIRDRQFVAVPTGVEFNATGLTFLRTVQTGPYVWHIYEKVSQ